MLIRGAPGVHDAAMAFLLSAPPDTKAHRDDDFVNPARGPAQRTSRTTATTSDAATTPGEQLQNGSGEVLSPAQSVPARRYLVFADPVAFR